MFRQLFERSADAMFLSDPRREIFVDCNQAAVEMMRASSKEQLLLMNPADLSPEFQPDRRSSRGRTHEDMALALRQGRHRFEWRGRRMDGTEFPVEVLLTPIQTGEHTLIAAVCRDITERKRAERELLELTQALERRVNERTAELGASEGKYRALFEGASQGVVLHDENQVLEVNPSAVRILGRRFPDEVLGKHPGEFSPASQPNGESSAAMARKHIAECMTTGSARFDWLACDPGGREISLEVCLTRIGWSGRQIIQAFITDITERKRSQAALAESEARFSAAFQASPIIISISKVSDGRYVLVNDAFVNWTGYARAEILGRNALELGLWADQEDRRDFWAGLRQTGSVREQEWRFRNRAGRVFIMLVSCELIHLNHVPHILGMAHDITQRKQTEAELRASEARLRESEARFSAAFQASPALIGILRLSDGKYVLANDAHLNWLGYAREEVLGHTCLELGMWEDPRERDLILKDMRSLGSIRQRECRWLNRRGEHFTVLLSAETIHVNDTPHMLVMALDITERKQAEAELRESEAQLRESETRFSVAFQASPVFISIFRMSDQKFVLVNDALVNWMGCSREEMLGRTTVELEMWQDNADRDLVWKELRDVGSIRQRECRLRNRRGERFTILLSAETIKLNNTPHILSLAQDITQRKRAEEELLKTLEREKELSQLKSNFVSMVSHEFRTPLGIIQSSAELLRDFHPKMQSAEREEQLESISRNAHRMAGMMEEVLVLSRLDAGKLDFQPAALDLSLFCRRIVDEVLSATSRRCSIELALNSIPTRAQADERLLAHIFTNLLSNAVKYSEPGSAVHFFVAREGGDAVCGIRDQGIGISEEDQQHLFSAFHRGSNVGSRPGTGLGLLLVKRCADLHGGKVEVESRLGEGTTVTVRFPAF